MGVALATPLNIIASFTPPEAVTPQAVKVFPVMVTLSPMVLIAIAVDKPVKVLVPIVEPVPLAVPVVKLMP
jgi:hypothetical protein